MSDMTATRTLQQVASAATSIYTSVGNMYLFPVSRLRWHDIVVMLHYISESDSVSNINGIEDW